MNLPGHAIRQKQQPIRDEAYRRYVASMPYLACPVDVENNSWGIRSQAAHISVGNYARGMKADDSLCIPLCCDSPVLRGCHGMFDADQEGFARQVLGKTIDELKAERRAAYEEWKA